MEIMELNHADKALVWNTFFFYFKACTTGTYGIHFNKNCGNCRNSVDCFHVNGTCLSGCVPRYSDHQCKTRMHIFTVLTVCLMFNSVSIF